MVLMLAACGSRGSAKTDQTTSSGAEMASSSASAMLATSSPDKNGFDEATNTTATKAGVTVQVPEYYGEADDKGNYYAERGSSVAMLMFGDEEFDVCKEFEASQQLLQVRTKLLCELPQDTNDFSLLVGLQLTNAVVGLHHLSRLYEDRFTRSTFVVNDTLNSPF